MGCNLSYNCFLIEIHIIKKSLERENNWRLFAVECFERCDDEAMCVVSGETDIEDIHLPQFTFTEGAKLSPAGSENSLGTIIMILLPHAPLPPLLTLHSGTNVWFTLTVSYVGIQN